MSLVDEIVREFLPEMSFFEKHRDKIAFGGPDDCWLWSAGKFTTGYGSVRARGKMRKAHRESYEDKNGEDSASGLIVRHRCDAPLCVNPSHLVLGTQADNIRDMDERGRRNPTGLKGEAHGSAKLTEADIRTVRATYIPGSRAHGQSALAIRFGVSAATISLIVNHKRWPHVA